MFYVRYQYLQPQTKAKRKRKAAEETQSRLGDLQPPRKRLVGTVATSEGESSDGDILLAFGNRVQLLFDRISLDFLVDPFAYGSMLLGRGDVINENAIKTIGLKHVADSIEPYSNDEWERLQRFYADTKPYSDAPYLSSDGYREAFGIWYRTFTLFGADEQKLSLWKLLNPLLNKLDALAGSKTVPFLSADTMYTSINSAIMDKILFDAELAEDAHETDYTTDDGRCYYLIKDLLASNTKPKAIFMEIAIRFRDILQKRLDNLTLLRAILNPDAETFAEREGVEYTSALETYLRPPTLEVPTKAFLCRGWFILDMAGFLDYDRIGFRLQNMLIHFFCLSSNSAAASSNTPSPHIDLTTLLWADEDGKQLRKRMLQSFESLYSDTKQNATQAARTEVDTAAAMAIAAEETATMDPGDGSHDGNQLPLVA